LYFWRQEPNRNNNNNNNNNNKAVLPTSNGLQHFRAVKRVVDAERAGQRCRLALLELLVNIDHHIAARRRRRLVVGRARCLALASFLCQRFGVRDDQWSTRDATSTWRRRRSSATIISNGEP
jgi:hypothetical protein